MSSSWPKPVTENVPATGSFHDYSESTLVALLSRFQLQNSSPTQDELDHEAQTLLTWRESIAEENWHIINFEPGSPVTISILPDVQLWSVDGRRLGPVAEVQLDWFEVYQLVSYTTTVGYDLQKAVGLAWYSTLGPAGSLLALVPVGRSESKPDEILTALYPFDQLVDQHILTWSDFVRLLPEGIFNRGPTFLQATLPGTVSSTEPKGPGAGVPLWVETSLPVYYVRVYGVGGDFDSHQSGRYLITTGNPTGQRTAQWSSWIDPVDFTTVQPGAYNDLKFDDPQFTLPAPLELTETFGIPSQYVSVDFDYRLNGAGKPIFSEKARSMFKDVSAEFMVQALSAAKSAIVLELIALAFPEVAVAVTAYEVYSIVKPLVSVGLSQYMHDLGLSDSEPSSQQVYAAFGASFTGLATKLFTTKELQPTFLSKGIDLKNSEKILIEVGLETYGSFIFKETHSFTFSMPTRVEAFGGVSLIGGDGRDLIVGSYFGDRLDGGAGNDRLFGMDGKDNLVGGLGDDTLDGGPGDDWIDGGAGLDTVVFGGARSSYVITQIGGVYFIGSAASGTDGVMNVEFVQFADQTASMLALDTTAPTVNTFSPMDDAMGAAVGGNIVLTFSEAIVRGAGNIVLKTAAGVTVATYDAATSSNLSVSGQTLTLNPSADLRIFTSYKVEIGSGAVKDRAGNAYAGASNYNFTTQTMDGLYHFFVVAFAAAPGVEYMNQLAEAWNYGLSLKEIVNIFTTKHQFTDVYPVTLTNQQLATQLVTSIVKNSATDAAKAGAVADVIAALDWGLTRGDVIYNVFGNLANKPQTDSTWGHTAQQFLNQTIVARYFTEVMHNDTTDLATLRAVVRDVTPDTNLLTTEMIATLIGVELGHGG